MSQLFDDVLVGLVPETEIDSARGSGRPAVARWPMRRRRWSDNWRANDDILIAGPLLRRSPLIDEPTLVEIARVKGQDASAGDFRTRRRCRPTVTDVIIRRGDREVVRSVAANAGAQFSEPAIQA